jgi:hypothetical protein
VGDERKELFPAEFLAADTKMSEIFAYGNRPQLVERLRTTAGALAVRANNPDVQRITGGRSVPQIAAGLAVAGVAALTAPPAWLIVATTLVATKISTSGLRAVCKTLQDRKSQAAATSPLQEGT